MKGDFDRVALTGSGYVEFHQAEFRSSYEVVADLQCCVLRVSLTKTDFNTPNAGTTDIFLHLEDGRRIPIKVGEGGKIEPDGPIQKGWPDIGWSKASDPFPLEQKFTLTILNGGVIQQTTYPNVEEARTVYENIRQPVDSAEIRPASGKVIKLR